MTPFALSFDRPLLVKFIIQTSPDATIYSQTPAAYAKEKYAPQLIIEMLELLTADEMKVCDTESDIQAAIDEKKVTLKKNTRDMANIVDHPSNLRRAQALLWRPSEEAWQPHCRRREQVQDD